MIFLRKLFFPIAIIYWCITFLRNVLYDSGFFTSHSFSIPIIAVGNLSVGGTGKTPHIEYLISLLATKKIAVLSRGYKRKSKGFIIADDKATVTTIGDEPFQFYTKFSKEATIAVCADRKEGIINLQKYKQPEVILLDDAFQHRKVTAGKYILLTEYANLFTSDFILPFGNLREPSLGKKRADIVLVTKCPPQLSTIEKEKIKQQLQVNVPVFFSSIVYATKLYAENNSIKVTDCIENKLIVAGIARPKPFIKFVKNNNDDVLLFPDHHNFSGNDIKKILTKANGKKIVTTEKDYMRLKGKIPSEQLYYLPISVQIDKQKTFNKIILDYVG